MSSVALARLRASARNWCCVACCSLAFGAACANAQTLSSKAKESGCVDSPKVVEGATYRCTTASGAAAYFNVPESNGERPVRRASPSPANHASTPSTGNAQPAAPPGLPRIDPATQKGRDELRRKVLQDELATEERLLAESRAAYANGAPPPSPEERNDPKRYADRIARLRQAVQLHERNVDALRRELGLPR